MLKRNILGQLRRRLDREKNKSELPINWIQPHEYSLIPSRRLWVTPTDSFIHFTRWPWEYLAYLTLICEFPHDGRILELGCHHGRTAIGLLEYLRPPGRYEGLDIMKEQIKWAQKNLKHPCFQFKYADLYNGMYNPDGKISPEKYHFPYRTNFFNVVFAASLFTHLLPKTTKNYLAEISRVLKPNGKCLLSFCLLDYYRGKKTTSSPELYELEYDLPGWPGVKVNDLKLPEKLVGYRKKLLSSYCRQAGLQIKKAYPGYWSGSSKVEINEQDLVLIQKK